MRYRILLFILILAPALCEAKTVKQFEKEIKHKTQNLKDLQKSINEKQAEKERCLLEEKSIKRELSAIEKDLASLQKKSEAIRRDINTAEKKLASAEKDLEAASFEKGQWARVMNSESRMWYKAEKGLPQTFSDPVEEKLRLSALKKKKDYLDNAEQREVNSKLALSRWQSAKDDLLALKEKQEQNISAQETAKERKKDLLCSATGRRVVAENEVNKLRESAKALENLIVNLEKERELTKQDELLTKQMASKRKEFPWPVEGKISTYFGKSKHPELDTYVISNGIKLKTAQGADVKPVTKGEVMFTGEFRSYGQMIIIDHGGSLYTIYGNLGSILVEENQKVRPDTAIAKTAAKDPMLYFEVKYKGKSEDPLMWLK